MSIVRSTSRVFAELTLARRHPETKGAIGDIGAAEPGIAVAISHGQTGYRSQMSASRFAADCQDIGAELPLAVFAQARQQRRRNRPDWPTGMLRRLTASTSPDIFTFP